MQCGEIFHYSTHYIFQDDFAVCYTIYQLFIFNVTKTLRALNTEQDDEELTTREDGYVDGVGVPGRRSVEKSWCSPEDFCQTSDGSRGIHCP